MEKSAIRTLILQKLEEEFSSRQRVSSQTRNTGNDSESRAESKYDTLSTEQNYLADGLAKQALAAAQAMEEIGNMSLPDFNAEMPIESGALIKLQFSENQEWFFLAPSGGGIEVVYEGLTITVITPDSPIGARLRGCHQGDQLRTPVAQILQVR